MPVSGCLSEERFSIKKLPCGQKFMGASPSSPFLPVPLPVAPPSPLPLPSSPFLLLLLPPFLPLASPPFLLLTSLLSCPIFLPFRPDFPFPSASLFSFPPVTLSPLLHVPVAAVTGQQQPWWHTCRADHGFGETENIFTQTK